MTRKQIHWRGGRLDPDGTPPPVTAECHRGHVFSTTARDGQLVRCTECQDRGETTWILLHRDSITANGRTS